MADTLYMLLPIDPDDPEAVAFVARQAQRCAERSLAAGDTGAGPKPHATVRGVWRCGVSVTL